MRLATGALLCLALGSLPACQGPAPAADPGFEDAGNPPTEAAAAEGDPAAPSLPLERPVRVEWPASFDGPLALEFGRWLGASSSASAAAEEAFAAHGVVVTPLEEGPRRHLLAEIAGEVPGALLFVAPLPNASGAGEIDGASAGVLIELARVLAERSPAYGLRFLLVDVEVGGDPHRARAERLETAGLRVAGWVDELGGADSVRAVFSLDIPFRADLVLARDLRAHPVFREVLWSAATARGRRGARIFPRDTPWTRVPGLHRGLARGSGFRAGVPLVDEAFARPDLVLAATGPPSPAASTLAGQQRGIERSLELLGEVLVEGAEAVMTRLARIDAFPADADRPGASPAGADPVAPAVPPVPPGARPESTGNTPSS